MKEKKKHIEVRTHPNGYSLDIDKKSYMYFDETSLMAGIFYHLGLSIAEEAEIDFANNLMQAAALWPTVGESINANATLMTDRQQARENENRIRRELYVLQKNLDETEKELNDMRQRYAFEELSRNRVKKAFRKHKNR